MFLALKWGIARLCRSNSFRDTAINVKTLDFYFFSFCKIWLIFYTKSWKFHIIELFLLVISLEPFEVERHTIPHFKAWNKSFWPFFIQKYSEGSQYQIISKRKCPIFFDSDFIRAWSSNKFEVTAFFIKSYWLECLLWLLIGLKERQFQTFGKITLRNKNSLSLLNKDLQKWVKWKLTLMKVASLI